MKTVVFLILLYIIVVKTNENEFPPCTWSAAQWSTFNECASSQTQEIISNCIRQETSAKDRNTVISTICADQNKIDEVSDGKRGI